MSIDLIGRKLGPYEIVEFTGGDAVAEVFRGYDSDRDLSVTIKIVGRLSDPDPVFNARFRREAKNIAGLRHPNIVNVHDYGAAEGGHYIVMDYVDGMPLAQMIDAMRRGVHVLEPDDITFLVRQVAAALDHAHRHNVVHRAVTPASIVYTRSGQAILAEFGLSLLYSKGQEAGPSGTIFGPAEYMAPELIADARAAVPASDIYSLGIIVYELLTLERPYESESDVDTYLRELSDSAPDPRLLNPDIPDAVAAVVQKALARDPRHRFKGAMKFAEALETAYQPGARVHRQPAESDGFGESSAQTLVSKGTQRIARGPDGLPVASRPTAERVIVKRGLSKREERKEKKRLSAEHRRAQKEERQARRRANRQDFVAKWWRAIAVLAIVVLLLGAGVAVLQTLGIIQIDFSLPERPIVAEVTDEPTDPDPENATDSAGASDAAPTAPPASPATPIPSPTALQLSTATPIPALAYAPLDAGASAYRFADGAALQFVPAGTFTMGTDNRFRALNQRPAHTVMLSEYWIDRTEVTNDQFRRCVDGGPCDPPVNTRWYDDPDRADHPVVYVRYTQAVTYCLWLAQETSQPIGLPTEAQWEKAARWDPATGEPRIYPWGEEYPNAELLRYSGSGNGSTAVVGSYPDGISAYGVYDMAGNVWEWVADWYADDTYQVTGVVVDPSGPRSGDFRVFRGGGWLDSDFRLETTYRTWARPTGYADNLGFRCALNARRPVPDSGIYLTPLDLVGALIDVTAADSGSDSATRGEYMAALDVMQNALLTGENATALATATGRLTRLPVHAEAGLLSDELAARYESALVWIARAIGASE